MQKIDITAERCPMTFVRVKLKLESMQPGEQLEIRLQGDEPLASVPQSLKDTGFPVLSIQEDAQAGVFLVLTQRS
uniref:UPF0033 domain-containing protein n=1 Tax=Magnetococcus massalia (strain MO-1) TaxID=451514 RepID=A0A1S7LJV8_MAGMO|nr:Conserved protein of unknown function [Candidatus Magnetococcus massalia]